MRQSFAPTLRRAVSTAMLGLPFALLVPACENRKDTLGPEPAGAVAAQANLGPIPGDLDAIHDLVAAVTAAWSAKDAAAYAAPYTQDVQVVSPVGTLLSGRAAFQAQHAFLFSGPFAGSTQAIDVRAVLFLTGTIALVYQDVTLTGYAFLPPGLPSINGMVRTRVTWVVVKRGAQWEIVFQHMTPRLT